MLELQDISKDYTDGGRNVSAVQGISLSVAAGEFVAIQGPSGCGKSTLLLIAGGLLAPTSGIALVDKNDIYKQSANDRARLRNTRIGFVFQQLHLVPYLSVLDNVRSPALVGKAGDATQRATELLTNFGMSHRLSHLPGKLSSGERQRTAMARAMLKSPSLILADEPTGNLDSENSKTLLKQLRDCASNGAAVLLVTHDVVAAAAADRVISIRDGKLTS